jgi:hypothetical protein
MRVMQHLTDALVQLRGADKEIKVLRKEIASYSKVSGMEAKCA